MSTEHTPGPVPEPEPAHARAAGPDGRDAEDPGGAGEPGRPDGGRRRPGVLVAAAVAAAVMLTGGGVAYLVDRTDDGGGAGSDGGEPPPLRLDGLSMEAAARGGSAPLRLVGELPDGPDEAPVFEPAGRVEAADVARLAAALGMDGKPREEGGGWRVGVSRDGQGPLLQVQAEAPGAWTYQQYGGTACDLPLPAEPDGAGPDAAVTSACEVPVPRPRTKADAPVPAAAAEKAAEPVLAAVGQEDAEVAAAEPFGAVRTVTAEPVVGGLPTTGWQTSLQIAGDGQVTGGNGYLVDPAEADTYPVITADAAFEELAKPSGGGGEPAIAPACASAVPYEEGTGPGKPPAGKVDPCLGKMEATKVRGAEFGLSAQSVEGRPVLVPSWLFQVTSDAPTPFHDGKPGTVVWPQLAVAPEYVTEAEPSTPAVPEPAPPTSAPGAEPTAGGGSAGRPGSPAPSESSDSGQGSPGQVGPAEPAQPPSSAPAEEPESRGGAVGSPVGIESYSVDGRTLKLHFWGGVCTEYAATADEAGGAVTVRLTGEDEPGEVCIKIAKRFTETVELSAPLDGRKVVDARTGERVAAK
ncbi:hypothetical protein DMB38_07065 [Streptomyces sp. WAC 06738]|uniref:hypothetical protein n=1 Tax=Streptomyces sp. WAC 06738 TaxID=2203210 RepID=UPI000F6C234E|nr:hypothetical protein [Streptomyces sp. WAC 06738]AZM45625.1 hypothetical protein DMB38_07065 [Streptomyces sp. WAC 06738]